MLPDAAHLQEEEAAFANRHRTSRHDPALPLFTTADAERALTLVERVDWGVRFAPVAGVEARFVHAGHILGAAIVECEIGGRRLVFSGDLGRYGVPIMVDPDPVPEADVLLVESTYGDRLHPSGDPADELTAAVRRAAEQNGWLLIPAFAVGRAQEILYDLRRLEQSDQHPEPARLSRQPDGHPGHRDLRRPHRGARRRADAGSSPPATRPFAPQRFRLSRSVEDSKRLNDTDGPGIILAGSGMATGGRILHHLKRLLPDPRTTVLFVGYQAAGTRGRLLKDGARELKMLGSHRPRARRDRGERRVLRACRSRRDPALARRLSPAARRDLRRARRGGGGLGAARRDHGRARLESCGGRGRPARIAVGIGRSCLGPPLPALGVSVWWSIPPVGSNGATPVQGHSGTGTPPRGPGSRACPRALRGSR